MLVEISNLQQLGHIHICSHLGMRAPCGYEAIITCMHYPSCQCGDSELLSGGRTSRFQAQLVQRGRAFSAAAIPACATCTMPQDLPACLSHL